MIAEVVSKDESLSVSTMAFYTDVLRTLVEQNAAFLVGGAFAFRHYTGIARHTKDLDLFVRPEDAPQILENLRQAGFRTEMKAPHWLGKIHSEEGDFVDIIFSSGNGVAVVDDEWFEHAEGAVLMDLPVWVSPAEETIWSKAYVLERERYDGADVAHLLRARGAQLDWERLLRRFENHWHVLFSHVVLFRFIYPCERDAIPRWVLEELMAKLREEMDTDPLPHRICQGTLLSARQYLVDVESWDYHDARLSSDAHMTAADIALLTTSIRADERRAAKRKRKPFNS